MIQLVVRSFFDNSKRQVDVRNREKAGEMGIHENDFQVGNSVPDRREKLVN